VRTVENDDDDDTIHEYTVARRSTVGRSLSALNESVISESVREAIASAVALVTADLDKPLASSTSFSTPYSAAPLIRDLLKPISIKLNTLSSELACFRDFNVDSGRDFIGKPRQEPNVSRRSKRSILGDAADWTCLDALTFVNNNARAAHRALLAACLVAGNASQDESLLAAKQIANEWFESLANFALESMARHAASDLLRKTNLAPILEFARLAAALDNDVTALEGPAVNQISYDTLNSALRAFYSTLFSSPTPDFKTIYDRDDRATARRATATILANAHHVLSVFVKDPTLGGYQDTSFLVHTTRQVRVLLDLDDDDDEARFKSEDHEDDTLSTSRRPSTIPFTYSSSPSSSVSTNDGGEQTPEFFH